VGAKCPQARIRGTKFPGPKECEEKTKYMPITKKGSAGGIPWIEIDSYKFETVRNFNYLGSEVNCKNDIGTEIKKNVFFLQVDVSMDLRNI
jgi:hypothetical protein